MVTDVEVTVYVYDSLNRLTSATYSTGEVFEYAYDAVGNRTAMTTTEGTTTYEYDAANRLTSVGGVTYTWDARGNLVSDGTFTYTYNAAGRMVQAQSITGTLVYTYNADGLRVAQSVESSDSVFSWDWASGLPEMLRDGGSLYLVCHDTLGRCAGAAWAYYLPDVLDSVRQVADGAGAVASSREWTPFGVEVGAGQAGLGYTGEWWDADVGLQYLRARWYDGYLNQFISPDTIVPDFRNPQSINRYGYALGNPIRYTDPAGLVPYIPPDPPNHRDLTYWLYEEIRTNANGYYAQRISTLLASNDPVDKARAVAAWIFLVKDKAKWDFKHRVEYELDQSIVLRDSNGYRWYEYSVPGNIHYAFVGRAAGFSGSALHAGAGYAEVTDPAHAEAGEACCPVYCRFGWVGPIPYAACIPLGCYYVNPDWWRTSFDDPSDWQNVEFGVQLFETYGAQLTFDQFQDSLAARGDWLTLASSIPEWNWVNPKGGWPYEAGRFDGPEAGQNERWVRSLLGGQQ
jgi:RHS repeat-associated protein